MSVYSDVVAIGNVGAVVSNVAEQVTETPAGAQWLSSYIDPAHGNCLTIPDEDNSYSFAIQSKFLATIDRNLFVQSSNLPTGLAADPPASSFNFTIYSTSCPLYPLVVKCTQWYVDNTGSSPAWASRQRYVYWVDTNLSGSNQNLISQLRTMYKGMTVIYTGNQYNNQGYMVCAPYNGTNGSFNVSSTVSRDGYDFYQCPSTPDAISRTNRDFSSFTTQEGAYCVNKFYGSRSEYVDLNLSGAGVWLGNSDAGGSSQWVSSTNAWGTATLGVNGVFLCNLDVVCCSVVNMDMKQSLLVKYYGGYQCHLKANVGATAYQTNKSYLDMGAIINASKLNAVLPSVYPSSYNKFKEIWNKIRSFLKSSGGKNIVNAVSAVAGPFGGFIDAAYGLL